MRKVIFCDLDGTLLDEKGMLPYKTIALLEELHHRLGVKLIPTSGRDMILIKHSLSALSFFDGCICLNGGMSIDENGGLFFSSEINKHSLEEIVKLIFDFRLKSVTYFTQKGRKILVNDNFGKEDFFNLKKKTHIFKDKLTEKEFTNFINLLYQNTEKVDTMVELLLQNVVKVEIFFENTFIKRLFLDRIGLNENIEITCSCNENIEIMNEEVSKGNGIKKYCKYLNIDVDDIIVFGDNFNDISAFDQHGLNVAVGNAVKPLKEKATYITKSNAENGVYYFLKQYYSNFGYKF